MSEDARMVPMLPCRDIDNLGTEPDDLLAAIASAKALLTETAAS